MIECKDTNDEGRIKSNNYIVLGKVCNLSLSIAKKRFCVTSTKERWNYSAAGLPSLAYASL